MPCALSPNGKGEPHALPLKHKGRQERCLALWVEESRAILTMARKDSEKDSERPHYYSQFWLDVAAGRRIIGAPKPEDGETAEPEIPEPTPQRRGRVAEAAVSNGIHDIVHPATEPVEEQAAYIEPDNADYSDQDELDYQEEAESDFELPDMDLDTADEDEDYFDEEEEEEDDDMNWGRSRKKRSPRAAKPPVKKPGKRDTRRGY